MNKYYNKVRYSKKFEMYDFEFFDLEKIEFFYGNTASDVVWFFC